MKPKSVPLVPKLILITCGIAIVILLLISFFLPSDEQRSEKMKAVQIAYINLHNHDEDSWWIRSLPGEHFYTQVADVAWKRGEEIRTLLAESATACPETQGLWNTFNGFATSFQINAGLELMTVSNPTDKDKVGLMKGHEVSFLPKSLASVYASSGGTGHLLGWRSDMGISIAAIEWPKKILSAIMFHELYHGSIHPVDVENRHLTQISAGSSWYTAEEIDAERIESKVLNYVSQGAYFKKIDEIIKRRYPWSNAKDIAASITIDDLQEFDRMFELEDRGLLIAQFTYSQFLSAVVIRYLDQHKEESGMKLFSWFQKTGINE